MGSPSELSLDFKPNSFSLLLKSFGDQPDQTQKMEEVLACLEAERHKIDAFKRELPLCMKLLNDAMEAYRQQLESYQTNQGSRPVLEEFMPLKHPSSEESDKASNMSEKANWLTSMQLWSQAKDGSKHQPAMSTSPKGMEHGFSDGPKLALDSKQRNGGAFLPFSKERNMCASSTIPALPDLALASIGKDNEEKKCLESGNGMSCPRRENCNKGAGGATIEHGRGTTNTADGQAATSQTQRKARRCWSPDLHRRFVIALQMLGGSQVSDMGSPSELSLDFKPNSFSLLLKSFGDQPDQTQKMEDVLACLEAERHKIDAFKRELPLCMKLLNDAMEAYRQQLESYQTNQGSRPVLEEFMPLKHPSSEELDKASNMSEKANWLTSMQLWSQANDGSKHQPAMSTSPKGMEHGFSDGPKLALDSKQRNGGAFLPFSKERNMCASSTIPALPDLALASIDKDNEEKKCLESGNGMSCPRRENCNKAAGGATIEHGRGTTNTAEGQAATSQTQRKARRCWSPDLHRRFVNALQMLGGSQVATPKQIRELMKVDGLTNDEVKSHLQKYRLHTRRPGPTPSAPAPPTPQLVVLGGIWVQPEYAAAHGAPPAIYGAHPATHASTHYCTPPVPQEFYPAPPHHAMHHHYTAYNRGSSQTHSSPETDGRGAGERSESIEEEGKSESSSWKGVGGGESEKGLLSLRDEGGDEDSNGSDITLKF
ncbi:myb family transcription factor EFM [Magnolia sinica]|uniref:myb family transcription factor EFM n=1 Tax=Magnolia sinica TaxID=86752 RepID=UPI00265B10B2|nr:myb family transcription factor EFM [Magnolia sinica]